MDGTERAERRKHRRFQVQDIAFAVLRNQGMALGQITDISLGGLAFHYIATKENDNGASELDILLAYNGLYMEKIRFKTISDFQIANRSPFTPIIMKRCGIKFVEIAGEQTSMLENFIRHHTTDSCDANPLKKSIEDVANVGIFA